MGRPRKGSVPLPPKPPSSGKVTKSSSVSSIDITGGGRKRGRKLSAVFESKLVKLDFRHSRGHGQVLTLGQGDTGQLGLGEEIMEKMRPGLVPGIENAVDAVAGGMHTAVLDLNGKVWSFGCNDEGSLGREVAEEEDCFVPGMVELDEKVVMLSAGDSHTAALTESGDVWAWGTFRDSSGPIGLIVPNQIERKPVGILKGKAIIKICSGSDHLVMLSNNGEMWTLGNGEQGQLGRVGEKFAHRGGRRGLKVLLTADQVKVRSRLGTFKEVWAGSYNTVARMSSGDIVAMGLNNYSQLAIPMVKGLTFFMPEISPELSKLKLNSFSIGQHHSVCLDSSGKLHSLGRSEYGRLGLGRFCTDANMPQNINNMEDCVEVACGTAVSYSVNSSGECYSWGMGTNGQLGTGEEEDVFEPLKMEGKQLQDKKVIVVSSGGQHTVLIAK